MSDVGPTESPDGAELVATWVNAVRALGHEARVPGLADDLTDIGVQAARPGVRVAVVAAQARFSDLVAQQFLGRTVLPARRPGGPPVLITAGPEASLEAATEDGWVRLPAGPDGPWSTDDGRTPRAYRLRLPADAHAGLPPAVEVLCYPERPDGEGDAPAGLSPLAADAVIVAVSATAPLTQSESTVIERLLAQCGASRLLVVVTRLELVEEDERDQLTDYVRRRARALSTALRVVVQRPGAGPDDPGEHAALCHWLTDAVLPDAAAARRRRLAERLAGCLGRVAGTAHGEQRARREAAAERAEARERARLAHEDELRFFDELRAETQTRHNQTLAGFLRSRDTFQEQLTRALLQQAKRASDPAAWWQQEAVYQMETRLAAWREGARKVLYDTTGRHVEFLDSRLEERFGLRTGSAPGVGPASSTPSVDAGKLPVTSLRYRRLLYRMGPTGVAALGVLLIPGVGPVAALAASLVGTGLAEVRLRTLADEQYELIRQRLPELLDALLTAESRDVTAQLAEVYRHMENEVLRLRRQWRDRQAAQEWAAADGRDDAGAAQPCPDWADLARRAELLAERIRAEAGCDPAGGNDELLGKERNA